MPAAEVAQAHQARNQALAGAAAELAASQWARVDGSAIAATWQGHMPRVAAGLTGAQLAAAQGADPYVAAVMADGDVAATAETAILAASLAGVAADGRDLVSLLYQPAITALVAIQRGAVVERAMALGLSQLDTIVRTEVADAGRTADQIATTTHGADGYVRLVVGVTCNRCLILAGRWYRWSAGFLRHPCCDCVHVPAGENDAPLASPLAIYERMTPAERSAAGWSQAEQKAIDHGADLYQVTNIHRGGLYVAGGRQFTREAAGKRPRITPRQIFIEARGDRAEAIRLLKLHRYIIR